MKRTPKVGDVVLATPAEDPEEYVIGIVLSIEEQTRSAETLYFVKSAESKPIPFGISEIKILTN